MKIVRHVLIAISIIIVITFGFWLDEKITQYYMQKAGYIPDEKLQITEYMTTEWPQSITPDHNCVYQVCCPSCEEILIYGEPNYTVFRHWYTTYPTIKKLDSGQSIEPNAFDSQSYCGKCGYPFGTDWEANILEETNEQRYKSMK